MAAPVHRGEVRVRLLFDYPPPALPQSRHLWFMLDTGQCRAITDVTAIIRERFFYSHGGALSLYLDGCLLPPGESVRLIRDNDAISVKWEDSRPHDSPHQASKKRVEDESDDCRYLQKTRGGYRAAPEKWREEEHSEQMKKKKREVTPEEEVSKCPKKKRRRRRLSSEEVSEQPKKKEDEEEARKKPKKKKEVTEDEEEARKKPKKKKEVMEDEEEARKKPKKKEVTEDEEEARKKPKKKKEEETPAPEGSEWQLQSGLSVEGSEKTSREPRTKKPPHVAPNKKTPPLSSTYRKEESSSSSDTEDRRVEPGPPLRMQQRAGSSHPEGPILPGLTTSPPVCNGHVAPHRPPLVTAGRGTDRGRGLDNQPPRGRGFRDRGEAKPHNHFFYNYSPEAIKQQQLNEDVSHVSVVVQNPPEVPIKDYSALPLLAAPPQPGNVLAFKLLELTENYTPEVSDYKEGRVLSYNPVSQQLEVEILSQQKRKEPGKFDLVYELEDGTDIVEYAVPQECKISQAWSSLIDPRLVTEQTAVLPPCP